jgi:hypothetical protein
VSLQASFHGFLTRRHTFADLRQKAIENRAWLTLKYFLRTYRTMRFSRHIYRTIKFYRALPKTNVFFITKAFLQTIESKPRLHPVAFGYTSNRCLAFTGTEPYRTFLAELFNGGLGRVAWKVSSLASLLGTDTKVGKATHHMFDCGIPSRWIRQSGIMRISFSSEDEAARRITLFGFMTENFGEFMDQEATLQLCAADKIRHCFMGFSRRLAFRHVAAQFQLEVNLTRILNRERAEQRRLPTPKPPEAFSNFVRAETPTAQAIQQLRGEFCPWEQWERPKPKKMEKKVESEPIAKPEVPKLEMDVLPIRKPRAKRLTTTDEGLSRPPTPATGPRALIDLGKEKTPRRYETVRPQTDFGPHRLRAPTEDEGRPATQIVEFRSQSSDLRRPSSQFTDNTLKFAVRDALARLVRLRQLGVEIEADAIEDYEMQTHRTNAMHVETHIKKGRAKTKAGVISWLDETRERNHIEEQDRREEAWQVRVRALTARKDEAKRVRTAHANCVQKTKQEKEFAQHFVNLSRQVAQVCETKRRKQEEREVFAKVRAAVGTARKDSQEAKERHKNTIKKIGRANQKDAKQAKELVEQKRDYQKTKHQEMMERIRNWKKEERAILQQVNEMRKVTRVTYPNGAPALETDEAQGAAVCIGMFVGNNVGLVEAQLLVDIIASVL